MGVPFTETAWFEKYGCVWIVSSLDKKNSLWITFFSLVVTAETKQQRPLERGYLLTSTVTKTSRKSILLASAAIILPPSPRQPRLDVSASLFVPMWSPRSAPDCLFSSLRNSAPRSSYSGSQLLLKDSDLLSPQPQSLPSSADLQSAPDITPLPCLPLGPPKCPSRWPGFSWWYGGVLPSTDLGVCVTHWSNGHQRPVLEWWWFRGR